MYVIFRTEGILGLKWGLPTSKIRINTKYTCCKSEMVGCKVNESGERKKIKKDK